MMLEWLGLLEPAGIDRWRSRASAGKGHRTSLTSGGSISRRRDAEYLVVSRLRHSFMRDGSGVGSVLAAPFLDSVEDTPRLTRFARCDSSLKARAQVVSG